MQSPALLLMLLAFQSTAGRQLIVKGTQTINLLCVTFIYILHLHVVIFLCRQLYEYIFKC